MLLIHPEAETARQGEIIDRVRKIASDAGGSVDKVDEWGKKRLAYEIDHISDAYYYVLTLTAESEALDEIARVLKITDEVIRFMPVCLPEKAASEKAASEQVTSES